MAKLNYADYGMVRPGSGAPLSTSSADRIAQSEDFKKELRKISKYVEFKKQTSVELNEAKFGARREDFNAEKEDEKNIEERINGKDNDIKREYYLDEVFRITKDMPPRCSKG